MRNHRVGIQSRPEVVDMIGMLVELLATCLLLCPWFGTQVATKDVCDSISFACCLEIACALRTSEP